MPSQLSDLKGLRSSELNNYHLLDLTHRIHNLGLKVQLPLDNNKLQVHLLRVELNSDQQELPLHSQVHSQLTLNSSDHLAMPQVDFSLQVLIHNQASDQ